MTKHPISGKMNRIGLTLMNSHITRKITFATLFTAVFIYVIIVWGSMAVQAATTTATPDSNSLQAQIDADNQQIATLNLQIAQYQVKLQQIGADKKTLQAAINTLDLQRKKVEAQISVTQRQINTTQLQIKQLGGKIVDTEKTIATNRTTLGAYLRNLQIADGQSLLMQMLSSDTISQIWDDINANIQLENDIQDNISSLKAQKVDLTNSQAASREKQATLTAQNKSLALQQKSLAATVQSKNQLLADTKAQESNYQKLLAAAEAQVKSFSDFVKNAGGSKLLPNQTVCDAWGCYYNQRDMAWGSNALNGTQFNLASDGCLVTSMAMIMTHYNYRDVTPVTINSNPDNFAVYYPAYLLYTINVDGVSVTRKTAAIDSTLSTGNPVVIGLKAYGGTHFVVLVSGSRGKYLMRDPYIANGKDISFSDHYSVRNIFGISKVVIGG